MTVFKFLLKDYLWSVFCSLTLGTGRSFCVLRLTCSRERSGQILWIPPLPQTWAPPRGTPCSSRGSSLRPKRRVSHAGAGTPLVIPTRSRDAAAAGRRRGACGAGGTHSRRQHTTRHCRHERRTQCDNTELPGYLKQYAIQAKPTNTDSTTASNNITMFMVLILFPSCSPAREGSRTLVRRRRPRLSITLRAMLLCLTNFNLYRAYIITFRANIMPTVCIVNEPMHVIEVSCILDTNFTSEIWRAVLGIGQSYNFVH